jgi:hypothetical protein
MSTLVVRRVRIRNATVRMVIALAAREGIRLVRHPVFLGGAVLSLGLFGLLTWNLAPVLHRDDIHMGGALLILAAATLIAANLSALRSKRDGSEELFGGLPASAMHRTLAHLLSLLWAAGASIFLIGIMFVWLLLDDPVGAPRLAELAVGPAAVMTFGAIGIALARWKPHVAIAPVAVVGLAALQVQLVQYIVGIEVDDQRTMWLAPWTPLSLTSEVPPELVIRPAEWHLVYLLGIAALFVAAALLCHRSRRRVVAGLCAAMLVTLVGAGAQLRAPSEEQRRALAALVERPEDFQVCRERQGVTYCAYPAYAPWIERWARPVEGVLDELPESARPQGLVVRQSFGIYFEGLVHVQEDVLRRVEREGWRQGDLLTGYEWGRLSAEGQSEIELAFPVAAAALGFPMHRDEIVLTPEDTDFLKRTLLPDIPKKRRERYERRKLQIGRRWSGCHTADQARAVAANWLAGQATPATRELMTRLAADSSYGLFVDRETKTFYNLGPSSPLYLGARGPTVDRVEWADQEFLYAVELLRRPDSEVGSILRENWGAVIEPEMTVTTFSELFDLKRLSTVEEQAAQLEARGFQYDPDQGAGLDFSHYGSIPCR